MNDSGYGSWPYILAFDFDTDNLVEYGSNAINVEYGNTDDYTSISLANNSPADEVHLHLTITEPALNIDPTTADKWRFNLAEPAGSSSNLMFASNETDTNGNALVDGGGLSLSEQGDMGCVANCLLTNSTDSANGIVDGLRDVMMTETGANTAVFESWAVNGTSQLVTVDEVGGDKKVVFSYGGDSVDMILSLIHI